jgi:predicted nucleotidyltransferase
MNNNIIKEIKELVQPYGDLCYLVYAGSLSYGTNTPTSDLDVQGIVIPHLDYILNIKRFEQKEYKSTSNGGVKCEGTFFDVRKAFQLFTECNPNSYEMLWVEDNFILHCDEIGKEIRNYREAFLSKKIKHTCGGYAFGQMQRMKQLSEDDNTNKDRLERFQKYGYDTKNASHLMRIISMGYEALVEHKLNVHRSDRDFLRQIKDGRYTEEQICDMAQKKFELLETAYINSTLPHAPDREAISMKLRQILLRKICKSIGG